jgi:predicted unusual protein kinase regulating ubiquinone biosynthesis (AarF/ABC1/UbiB family)
MAKRDEESVTGSSKPDSGTASEGDEAVPPAQEIPTGRLSRFMKLSALSAGASSRYLGNKVKGLFQEPEARAEAMLRSHLKTAQKTVEVMGNLKGAVMKVGQMISLNPENSIIPPELTAAFNRLQSQAPTLPYASIQEQIVKELGRPPEELFAWFDERPMAAASLGQVHAARLPSGDEVVVKIQYPGIDKTVESDLWHLRTLFKASGFLGRAAEAEKMFEEVRRRLVEELDYTREAQNLIDFRKFFERHPRVLIPRHYSEFSSERVLTMERMPGMTLEEVLARHPEQSWRNQLGIDLFELLMLQMMDFRRMHADPQLGNFRFLDDGRVVMLDLGCVKCFEDDFLQPYLEVIEAGIARDRRWLARSLADLGIVPEGDEPALKLIWEFLEVVLEPLQVRPYRYVNDGKLIDRLKAIGPRFLAYPEIQGHPDLVYLHRTYAGLYYIMTVLEAEADWWALFLKTRERTRPAA